MTSSYLFRTCSSCGAKNRIPVARRDQGPKCGRCGHLMPPADTLSRPLDITDATFADEVLTSRLPVLLDCWAPWCGPCQTIGPALHKLAGEFEGRVKICKLHVDQNPSTATRFTVQSVPTLLFFRGGEMVERVAGALPEQAIRQKLTAFT